MKDGTFSKITQIEQIFRKHELNFSELNYSVDENDKSNDFVLSFDKKQQQERILEALEEMQQYNEVIKITFKT